MLRRIPWYTTRCRQRRPSAAAVAAPLLLLALIPGGLASAAASQPPRATASPPPAGTSPRADAPGTATFQDDRARELVMGALAAQEAAAQRPDSHTLFTSRARIGYLVPNQWRWRDRTFFHKEIAARLDPGPADRESLVVLARRRGAPTIGDTIIDNPPLWNVVGFDPEDESPALLGLVSLALGQVSHDLPKAITGHSFQMLDTTYVEPVSPAGLELYTFRSFRTMHARKPVDRRLEVVEVRPKRATPTALLGVVCFDPASGRPVWALYRPRGRWKLRAGLRGFVRAVPLVPKDAEGEIEYIAVQYDEDPALPAVPVEALAEGTMYWIADQVLLPVKLNWHLEAPERTFADSARLAAEPAAWIPPPLSGGNDFAPNRGVLSPYLRQLDKVTGAPPWPGVGAVLGATAASIRFNQVQGVSFRVAYPMPLGARTTLTPAIGIATSGFEPTGELAFLQNFRPWSWGVRAYSELQDANWMEKANGFFSSITAIVSGYDDGNYYLSRGVTLWGAVRDRPVSARLGLFAERHFDTPKTADWSIFEPDVPAESTTVLVADEGFLGGLRGQIEIQRGDDPQRGVLVGRALGQAALGDFEFASLGLTGDAVGPLLWRLAGALRASLTVAGGDVPTQGLSYLGGTKTVRGYPSNAAVGASSLTLNAEVGNDLPLFRVVLFSDVGWANDVGDLFDDQPLVAAGEGLSVLDGTMRVDFAKGLTGDGVFRVHFAASALF